MTFCYRPITLIPVLALIVMAETRCASAEESEQKRKTQQASTGDPRAVVDVVSLDESALVESSGLAISRRRPRHFWTHNDSGGTASLFAFDWRGTKSGQILFKSTEANDWEDMASYTDEGVPRLLIADCGDNQANRSSITLHLLDEPDPQKSISCQPGQTITIVYPDGPRDCEAIAVDQVRRQIVFISKSVFPAAGVYVIPLPSRQANSNPLSVTAKRIATLPLPMVTAIDIDQINGDLWVVSYFQAFQFRCVDRDLPLKRQIDQLPQPYELPRWKQIESVAVDEAHHIWVTSEGSPTPLGRLPQENRRTQTHTPRPPKKISLP